MSGVAEHRPATRRRRFAHDELIAVDLFSGFGGLTEGLKRAGFTTIMAANHNRYKVKVHEANHPEAEHWIADLINPDSADYHSARDLPAADILAAGVTCTNHSQANTQKAYTSAQSLFDLDDPDFDARVTKSERDRATANCTLHYAETHHPRMILIECTTELVSWGPAVPGRAKVGDGSTYRWWLKQFDKLGYRHRILYLNSMFFGVPQSRDRLYIAFWDRKLPAPDLDHRPPSWCGRCDRIVEGVWTWRTGVPPTGSVRYGKQYEYRCAACRAVVIPPMSPSLNALDLTDLGTRIGDKPVKKQRDGSTGPLAAATLARAERCRQRFADFPAVLMPAKAVHGSERHPWQPMSTQTSQQETAILSTGALMVAAGNTYERPGSTCRSRGLDEPLWTQSATNTAGLITPPVAVAVDNFQGAPRGVGEPLPTQVGSETLGLLSARVMPNRTNATSRDVRQPMETIVGGAGSGGLGVLSSGVVPYRKNTISAMHSESMPTVTAEQIPGLLTATGLVGLGVDADPTSAALMAEWRAALADLPLEDCYFRMMAAHEVGRGCGFDVDFPDHQGAFVVWGSARNQVDGFGNAVSPQVGEWIGARLRAVLHAEDVVAA